ncbi:DUF1648 domain-containing protein [Bacillus vallismortis]|uniref:DUF1648 domain-containing protein n=1 Tax=Bacillus vallismortis TaxID=72361 RepID=A0AAP3CIU9_BACVA|nr:DUF1648 domain-containing protein [Bacillus vallismortis]MBG9769898.1 membrane protein [Bacillus vallismortis]MCI3986122.1 DUF1648 domain-containing protein [Bacillus vallismortis]MCI4136651.1 DUF1648 domain-containing protein [Bacillus vallismortis]MCY7894844.1 DUF1648 domain-containing protein [Bacillus vallismortis]MCY8309819.1 DUF1648 domain-containing protein [Bacillus vallismortis]
MFLLTNGKVLWGSVIAAFILSIVCYPFLPAEMPIHYDATNSPDMTVHKLAGTVILPVMMLVFAWARKVNWQFVIAVYILLICHLVILYLAV